MVWCSREFCSFHLLHSVLLKLHESTLFSSWDVSWNHEALTTNGLVHTFGLMGVSAWLTEFIVQRLKRFSLYMIGLSRQPHETKGTVNI